MHDGILTERLNACRPRCVDFVNECEGVNPVPQLGDTLIGTHAWALKTVIYTAFEEALIGNNIKALFFPLVKYTGVRALGGRLPSPMLHVMIFCRFEAAFQVGGTRIPNEPLRVGSLSANRGLLTASLEPGETIDVSASSIEYFEAQKNGIM
jgi:hypothetical protein